MNDFVIIPQDGTVVINGVGAMGVDMTGIPPGINAIQWYSLRNNGEIQYLPDPMTGVLPANEVITDYAPFQPQLDQAQEIIDAAENPITVYSTVSELVYQGVTYGVLGSPIIITTPNTPPPVQSTLTQPPTPETFQSLYWFNNAWVLSSYDPNMSLAEGQAALIVEAQQSGAGNVNAQASIYSMLELVQSPDPAALTCANYPTVTLGDYQSSMDAKVATKEAQINAATTPAELYVINPAIDPAP